jgi:hypothetical protein
VPQAKAGGKPSSASPAILIPGDHEFHGGEIDARLSEGRAAAVGTNVKMLDRETVVIRETAI